MTRIRKSTIKEIALAIARDKTCFLHRTAKKVTIIDHSAEDAKLIAAQAKLEQKIGNFIKIEQFSTEEQLVIMRDFADELDNKSLRRELSNALNRKNPVRNFNGVIESNMDLNLHWRSYRMEEYQRWVSNFIADAYHYH
ncbi:MAG: UPF0158 family protein [Saprospiraceae bacterium]|mgnify:FL=1